MVKLKNCSLNGLSNSSLVVSEEKRQLKNVLRVWTLDRKTGVLTSEIPKALRVSMEIGRLIQEISI